MAGTQFVLDLNKAVSTGRNMGFVCERMQELDNMLEPLAAKADAMGLGWPTSEAVDSSEAVVAKAIKGIARIKLNRYAANV